MEYKYSPDQRTAILAEIRNRMKADTTGRFKQIKPEALRVAEITSTAQALGIDPSDYGRLKGSPAPSPAPSTPRPTPPQSVAAAVAAAPIAEPVPVPVGVDPDTAEIDAIANLGYSEKREKIAELIAAARTPKVVVDNTAAALNRDAGPIKPKLKAIPVNQGEDAYATDLFGVEGLNGVIKTFDCPQTPPLKSHYQWQPQIAQTLATLGGYNNGGRYTALLWGPKGSGKTSAPKQFAAMTGRPFFKINFSRSVNPIELVGAMGIENGDTVWNDGSLTHALKQRGAVIVLDEIFRADPADLVFLNMLDVDDRQFTLETGEVVNIAEDVLIFACDNSNGNGDLTGQYSGCQVQDTSMMDRWAFKERVDYPDKDLEATILSKDAAITKAAAQKVISFANVLRKAEREGQAADIGPSMRSLVPFVCAIKDGWSPEHAFMSTVIGAARPDDQETAMQLWNIHNHKAAMIAAIRGEDTEAVQAELDAAAAKDQEAEGSEAEGDLPFSQ